MFVEDRVAFNLAGERKLLDGGSGGGERPLARRGAPLCLEPSAHRPQGDLGRFAHP